MSMWPLKAAFINVVSLNCRTTRPHERNTKSAHNSAKQRTRQCARRRRRGTYMGAHVLIRGHTLVQQPPHLVHLAMVGRPVQLPRHHWCCACAVRTHSRGRQAGGRQRRPVMAGAGRLLLVLLLLVAGARGDDDPADSP